MTTEVTTLPTLPQSPHSVLRPATFNADSDATFAALVSVVTAYNANVPTLNAAIAAAIAAASGAQDSAESASDSAGTASNASGMAQAWATSLAVVDAGLYSARYYAQQAALSVSQFKGSRDSDPPTAVTGDWYISTVSGLIRAYSSTAGWVNSVSVDAGVETVNGMTGNVVLDVPSTARVFFMTGV